MSTTSLPEQLVSLGFSPELAAVITPDEFREETERAWKTVLQELKGEKPDPAAASTTLQLKVLPSPPPSFSVVHDGQGEGVLSSVPGAEPPLFPSPIPPASAPAVSAEAADAGKAGEGQGEGCLSSSNSSSDSSSAAAESPDVIAPDTANDDDLYPCYTGPDINTGRFEDRYLIPGILTAGEPGGLFGSFKTLKTSLTADLLISLASGTPFLGQFAVPEPGRTLFMSGESGLAALQSLGRRICASRGINLDTLDTFELCPRLPSLDRADDVQALGRLIRRKRPVCLAIDPAYFAIRGGDARNLFAMGDRLQPLADLGNETGCTILVIHHCKRSKVHPGDPATLDDIAWTGFSEFAGQWLLVARRRRYDPETGHHELWFSTGGRAGHCGRWALDVDEGLVTNPGGRVWKPTLRNPLDGEMQHELQSVELAESRRQLRTIATNARHRGRILQVLRECPAGETSRFLRDTLGLTSERTMNAIRSLAEDRLIEPVRVFKRDRWEVGYRLSGGEKIPAGDEK
jgi:hypothetical protein